MCCFYTWESAFMATSWFLCDAILLNNAPPWTIAGLCQCTRLKWKYYAKLVFFCWLASWKCWSPTVRVLIKQSREEAAIIQLYVCMCAYTAIKLDGCRVAMYTARSLMDDFDWDEGYGSTFGLYQVDFTDPSRKRTAKASVSFYRQLIADNGWPPTSS